jgi:glycosyltransferase involved in cell wall biosynthesis
MTRLLLLTDTSILGAGGSERFLRNLIRHLPADRYEIDVLQLAVAADPARHVDSSIEAAHVRSTHFPVDAIYGRAGLAAFRHCASLLKSRRYDIVQSQHEKSDLINALLPRGTGHTVHISCRRDMGFQKSAKLRSVFRLINARFHKVVAPTSAILTALADEEGVSPEVMQCIPNGVDTARFVPATAAERAASRSLFGIRDGDSVIVCVASFSKVKRHCDLIAGFAQLRAGQPNVHLLLAGSGPLESELIAQVEALGIREAVTFAGNRGDVERLLHCADVFALCSDTEGLSNAIIEAQACGLPVVATRVGGNPDLVTDGENGFLVPARDPSSVATALMKALDPIWARHAAEVSRHRIENGYSLRAMADGYDQLYREMTLEHLR